MKRWGLALIFLVGLAVACLHAPASALPLSHSRSWVDRRVDQLSASELRTLPPTRLVDADRALVAERLVRVRRPLFWCSSLIQIFALFWAWRSGFAAHLRALLASRLRNRHVLRGVYAMIGVALLECVALPFLWLSYHLAYIVGVSREPLLGFLRDVLVATGVEMLVVAAIIVLIMALVDCVRRWYIAAVGAFLVLGVLAVVLVPVVIDPLFQKSVLLAPQSAWGRQLYPLEARAGVGTVPIFLTNLSRTSEVGNANVAGLGPTRRVFVGDSLLQTATPAEVRFVFAHELGHIAHNDALTVTLLADLLLIIALAVALLLAERVAVRGDDDPLARLPLLAALLGMVSLFVLPVGNAYSRMVEARADRFGLAVTHDDVAAARLFVRFADEGFTPICPPSIVRWYFYDHPPLGSRITTVTGRPDGC